MVKRLMAVMLMALLIAAVASVPGVAEADEPEEPDYTDPDVALNLITELEEADDMGQAFSGLPSEAQQAVIEALVKDFQVTSGAVRGRSNSSIRDLAKTSGEECDDYEAFVWAWALKKSIKLWEYTSSTHWCWNGTVITSDPLFVTSAEIYGLAKLVWDFEGDRTTSESGGKGESNFTDYAEGHFTLSIPDDIEIDIKKVTIGGNLSPDWYPSIWKYQYADGTSRYRTDLDN